MPQHKSAKKRLRQSERRRVVNKSVKSNVATQLKAIDKLIKDKKVEESMAKLKQVMSVLHKSTQKKICLLYTSPSPRDATLSRMPSSA